MKTPIDYLVGIDNGTQRLTAIFVELNGSIIAIGESNEIPLIKTDDGGREHDPESWRKALSEAMQQARDITEENGTKLGKCLGVCPSGQMHGECLRLDNGKFHYRARLWCDMRNGEEGHFLTQYYNFTTPQRLTVTRHLWTRKNQPELANQCTGITTPAGVLAAFLDQKAWGLGFGEACGMFHVNPSTGQYNDLMIEKFDKLPDCQNFPSIAYLLPPPVMVGTIIGHVDENGSALSGLPVGTPIFSPEGDQPTTLAGTFVWRPGTFSFSLGTSICANLISEQPFKQIHPGVEPFMTADGKPFYMCHVQNGTSWMNVFIDMYKELLGNRNPFDTLMPLAADAPIDCDGIVMLPLAEAEHGLGFASAGRSGIFNLRAKPLNATYSHVGCMVRAAFNASMFSILHSVMALREQGIGVDKIVASGGSVKSTWTCQAIADIFGVPVHVSKEADEGSAYGAALMAIYGHCRQAEYGLTWGEFLDQMQPKEYQIYQPDPKNSTTYERMFDAFELLVSDVENKLLMVPWAK